MRVPMPYWLFTTTNTTGSFQSAAMFMDSYSTPWLSAPSPKKATLTPAGLLVLHGKAAAQGDGDVGADDGVGAHVAQRRVGDVHGAALARAVAFRAAEDLREHAAGVRAARQEDAVAAVVGGEARPRPPWRSPAPAPTPSSPTERWNMEPAVSPRR